MIVIGIETSCDETAVTVLDANPDVPPRIASEVISSQVVLHGEYGGVVPEIASREHLKNLPLVFSQALRDSGIQESEIDGIGVTRGPGLKGCLLMGYTFAKGYAFARNLPFIGVNHIEGHLLSLFLNKTELTFPFIALVVSGCHTEILIVKGVGAYQLLARTIDDAAGEAFDKSANLLGFAYPGGAPLAALADTQTESRYKFPRVMKGKEGFSFSGLKTAIATLLHREKEKIDLHRAELCFAVQEAIVEALASKVQEAVEMTRITQVGIVGGVSANKALKKRLQSLPGVNVFLPSSIHSTDNASMIAYAAFLRLSGGERTQFESDPLSRWPVETLLPPLQK